MVIIGSLKMVKKNKNKKGINLRGILAGTLTSSAILGIIACSNYCLEKNLQKNYPLEQIRYETVFAPKSLETLTTSSSTTTTTPVTTTISESDPNYPFVTKTEENEKYNNLTTSISTTSIPAKETYLERIIKNEPHKEEFLKDSDEVLLARTLFGETREKCSKYEKIAVAYTVLNRINDGKKINGETLKEVILAKKQYSCFNEGDSNLKKIKNPEKYNAKEWKKCLNLSKEILKGKYHKHNYGQTHYHRKNIVYPWKEPMKEKLLSEGLKHQFYRDS